MRLAEPFGPDWRDFAGEAQDDAARAARALKRGTGRSWLVRPRRGVGGGFNIVISAPRDRRVFRAFALRMSDEDLGTLRRLLPFAALAEDGVELERAGDAADKIEAMLARRGVA